MPVSKITVWTAMRARDVSRPHEEHLAEAAARGEAAARRTETSPPKPAPPKPTPPKPTPPNDRVSPPAPAPPRRHRRRGR